MNIDWNMVILLVFITFNVIQVCNAMVKIFSSKSIIAGLPKKLLEQMVEASIENTKRE